MNRECLIIFCRSKILKKNISFLIYSEHYIFNITDVSKSNFDNLSSLFIVFNRRLQKKTFMHYSALSTTIFRFFNAGFFHFASFIEC